MPSIYLAHLIEPLQTSTNLLNETDLKKYVER